VLSGGFTLISRLAVDADAALSVVRIEGVDLCRELRAVRVPDAAEGTGERFWRWLQTRTRATR
jgi:hypothetical protein